MALPASSLFFSTPRFQIKMFKCEPGQIHRWPFLCVHPQPSPYRFLKMGNAQFGQPNKVKLELRMAREKLWEATPDPVKEFPWRKAGDVMLKRLLLIGQTTLKWLFVTIFIVSSISDVTFSISRNQELLIPVGLLIGFLMTNYLKEILQLMVQASEDKGFDLPLASISCFFVVVKVICTYFAVGTQMFLLHVANGGLMQVLWLWRHPLNGNDELNRENFISGGQDASIAADAEE